MRSGTSLILSCALLSGALYAQSFKLKTSEAGLSSAVRSNGVAVADYDLDGDLDIFFVAQKEYDRNNPDTWSRLFRNNGDGTFSDVTEEAGILSDVTMPRGNPMGFKYGANWGDYDNDGDPDLYLTNYGPNELYQNNGDGTFTEITETAGVAGGPQDMSSTACWWDYDLDGDLDLYVSTWGGYSTDPEFTVNKMFENVGGDKFIDVTEVSALGDTGRTWVSLPIDADNDGWLDIYVVNDFGANTFYRNKGDKTFEEATAAFGLEDEGAGMGVTVGDFDQNGFFDIYLTNIADLVPPTPNPLFANTGEGYFINRSIELGVDRAGWAWGCEFFDCDHDGDLDLYVVNGFRLEPGNNVFFLNHLSEGRLRFVDVSSATGTDGGAEARGLVVFDYDNDGDLDLAVANFDGAPYLYENVTAVKNWLKVDLEGTVSNRNAFGASVRVTINGRSDYRLNDGVEFLGHSVQPLHFGVGEASVVDELTVRWPNGVEETFTNIETNQTIKIVEGVGIVTSVEAPTSPAAVPKQFALLGNFPNPFNGSTVIRFELPSAGRVQVSIFNLLGRKVRTLERTFSTAGTHQLRWEGTDQQDNPLPSGFYLYRVRFQKTVRTARMVYLR